MYGGEIRRGNQLNEYTSARLDPRKGVWGGLINQMMLHYILAHTAVSVYTYRMYRVGNLHCHVQLRVYRITHVCAYSMCINVCVKKKKTLSNYVFGQEIAVRQEGGHVCRVDPEQLSVVELGFRVSAKRREGVCQGVQHRLKSDTIDLVLCNILYYYINKCVRTNDFSRKKSYAPGISNLWISDFKP